MARHESEMRRQRDKLREALGAILKCQDLATAKHIAHDALMMFAMHERIGLFADRNQMDLQDRRDI